MSSKHSLLDFDLLRSRLKLKNLASEKKLREKHPVAHRFFQNSGLKPGQIRQHAAKLLTSGALASSLLLSAPISLPTLGQATNTRAIGETAKAANVQAAIAQVSLAKSLQAILPPAGDWDLTSDQQKKISQRLKEMFRIKVVPELEGNKLNNQYGRMGAEQHLPRFPGDSAEAHGQLVEKGITPGLGGWGYVTDPEVEKYYVAVQTLYLPDWNTRTKYLVDWYKWRRMVAVNPANGKAIVVAVADAGPANWTGKHFGGSPEVMQYLGINYGMQNHPVVLFFLDDPQKEVPLGPLEYNVEQNKRLLANQA